jgi:Flp pilus assembly protein TadG
MSMTIKQRVSELLGGCSRRVLSAAGRFRRDKSGMAAIEFAFVFPFMLIMYFGVVDVADLLSANRKVTLAASALGDLVAQAPGTLTPSDLAGLYNAIGPIMSPIPASAVKINILTYRKNGSAAQLRWDHDKNGTCSGMSLPSNMIDMMADNNDLVVARVCISYQPVVGEVVGSGPFLLSDQFVLRPRESPTLLCSAC